VSRVRTLTPNFTVLTLKMWAYSHKKSPKFVIFGINLPKRDIPRKRFLKKLSAGGGCPRSVPLGQISPLSLLKCALQPPKSLKLVMFGKKFTQKGYTPLSDFFGKFGLGE